jgi:hypothetical protein
LVAPVGGIQYQFPAFTATAVDFIGPGIIFLWCDLDG